MTKIVRQHVSIRDLPEHLRVGLDPDALVTIEMIVEERPTLEGILARRQNNYESSDEIEDYVRSLRAEWAHREI